MFEVIKRFILLFLLKINSFRDAEEATKDQQKICLIENAKSLVPLVSAVNLQSDSIY